MAFRDENEALRAKNDVLTGDLRDAQRRLRAAEARVRAQRDHVAEAELARLRREVASLHDALHHRQGRFFAPLFASASALTLLLSGALTYLSTTCERRASHHSPPLLSVPSVPATSELDRAQFGAVVLEAEGRGLAPGRGCVVDARLTAGPSVKHVSVRCGDVLLYDSAMEAGEGQGRRGQRVRELRGASPGGLVYALHYEDRGSRAGPRSQIYLNTEAQELRIWNDGGEAPHFDATLYVQDRSVERSGARLGTQRSRRPAFRHALHVRATPIATEGSAPAWSSQSCELRVHAHTAGMYDCRLLVLCGGTLVYGAENTGYSSCAPLEGDPGRADDEGTTMQNGDAEMHLRWSDRRLRLADGRGDNRWAIDFRLERDPRCNLRGEWTGHVTSARSDTDLFRLTGAAGLATGDGENAAFDRVETELDCVHGRARLVVSDTVVYDATFGPGFQTLMGTARDGEALVFDLARLEPSRSHHPVTTHRGRTRLH